MAEAKKVIERSQAQKSTETRKRIPYKIRVMAFQCQEIRKLRRTHYTGLPSFTRGHANVKGDGSLVRQIISHNVSLATKAF